MMNKKFLISALCFVIGACLLIGLAITWPRAEKPKVAEKKMRVIEIAPTPITPTPTAPTGIVQIVIKQDTNSPYFKLPNPSTSTPETKRALLERRKAFMKKFAEQELPNARLEYDREMRKLEEKEIELRSNDPLVRDAYGKVMAVRQEYEEACAKNIPGYADQVKDAKRLRVNLEDELSRQKPGDAADAAKISEIRKNLNLALSNISRLRTAENPSANAVGVVFLEMLAIQSTYEQSLLKNNEYTQMKKQTDEKKSVIDNLTSM